MSAHSAMTGQRFRYGTPRMKEERKRAAALSGWPSKLSFTSGRKFSRAKTNGLYAAPCENEEALGGTFERQLFFSISSFQVVLYEKRIIT